MYSSLNARKSITTIVITMMSNKEVGGVKADIKQDKCAHCTNLVSYESEFNFISAFSWKRVVIHKTIGRHTARINHQKALENRTFLHLARIQYKVSHAKP